MLRRVKLCVLSLLLLCLLARNTPSCAEGGRLLPSPVWVYNNWSAYDEISDEIELDEGLAMRELGEMLRLRRAGVHFDYYMMDAFWYDPDGGYRRWRAASWPEGPERWIAACLANGIKPGLWFSTNTLSHLHAAPQWRSSLDKNDYAMALYSGGFLADFMNVLESWYERGVRMFKFDFADFDVAAKGDENVAPREIRRRNVEAFGAALKAFRRRHPDVVLAGFNGFVGNVESSRTALAPDRGRWLDVLDSLYSGDPRPSNVPEMDFWRSMDVYSDHMVRHLQRGGIPLQRIDSTSFMVGDTGTNYHRRTSAWRGSMLLMLAHGGWINTVHGNLEFLDDADARWLARVQALYEPLQRGAMTTSFGATPDGAEPYGFGSVAKDGALYTVVNPSQSIRTVRMLPPWRGREGSGGGRVLFRDAGFTPVVEGNSLSLGPGQLAVVGFGRYASAGFDLGVEGDVRIPRAIASLSARFRPADLADGSDPASAGGAPPLAMEALVAPARSDDLRIVLRQRDSSGAMMRSLSDQRMGKVFVISAEQKGRPLSVEIRYDKVIWSGLSWAVGEIRHEQMEPDEPIHIRISSRETDPSLHLEGSVYAIEYGDRPRDER